MVRHSRAVAHVSLEHQCRAQLLYLHDTTQGYTPRRGVLVYWTGIQREFVVFLYVLHIGGDTSDVGRAGGQRQEHIALECDIEKVILFSKQILKHLSCVITYGGISVPFAEQQ